VFLVCGAAVACAFGRAPEGDGQLDARFRDEIAGFNAAAARADTAALRRRLADDLIWVVGATSDTVGKARLLALAGTPQNPTPRFDIDQVHVRRVGDVAIVDYQRSDHRRLGGYENVIAWRVFETYTRDGAQWQVARHMQTPVRQALSTVLAMDSAALARFVGHYQVDPSYIDNIHFEGSELVATIVGLKVGAHLVPVSETAFIPDGDGPLLVFERDAKGRVLGYIQGELDGTVLRSRKID